MDNTQHAPRRPAAAMQGYALALSFKQRAADKQDAHRMAVFARLRASTTTRGRMLLLSGLSLGA